MRCTLTCLAKKTSSSSFSYVRYKLGKIIMHQQQQQCMISSDTRQFEGDGHSRIYARYRPQPPPTIIQHALNFLNNNTTRNSLGGRHSIALDVGCGSGQFTRLLTPHFTSVVASDVSEAQVKQARGQLANCDNVEVNVGSGEYIEMEDGSVDLVSVCQALHWMEVSRFYTEVDRVLKPGGVLAVVGYHFTKPAPSQQGASQLEDALVRVYSTTGPYWTPLRKHVDAGYRTLPVPSTWVLRSERDDDSHFVETEATFADWLGYIQTWSGIQNMIKVRGQEEVDQLMESFVKDCSVIMEVGRDKIMSTKTLLRTNYWISLFGK